MGQAVHDPPRRTLAARLEDRDRGRFTARERELAFLERCMDSDDPPASIVHISGAGGIGKSALLREVARRARARGFQVVACDGREYGPAPGSLETALKNAATQERPLVILDSYERMTALDPYLRGELLPSLPDRSLVVIAGRSQPDPGWFSGGWESVTARLDLGALAPLEARDLLAGHGLADERVPAIIDWAAGSPLALALAADAATADPAWNVASQPDRPDILRSLVHRLVDTDARDVRPSALGIAAIARTTTLPLMRAVLPGEDADRAYQQLYDLTVSEPLGDGIALHELVRKALLADLRLRNADLERDLRRRIVDYLYQRASEGQPMLIIDMAHLVEDPVIRWGFGWEGSTSLRIDSVRDGDADLVERQMGPQHNWAWWHHTRRYFAQAPDRVAVARDHDDQIRGYMVYMSQSSAPQLADTDPLIARWLAHARLDASLGESVLWQAAVDFTGQGLVQAMLGLAGVLRSGVANPRYCYLPIDPSHPGAREFARAAGATHLTELDADIGGQGVECHRLDFGSGGLLVSLRRQVYTELGLPDPEPADSADTTVSKQSPGQAPAPASLDLETVRTALKNFGVPRDLARSPLAQGTTVAERAQFVRSLLRDAAQHAFGDSASEKLLRNVLVVGYLEPASSHEAAAARLCLSRAAYFRRLRTAVERLAEYLATAA